MKLDRNRFSLAAAATLGIIYVVCTIVVALAPDFAVKLLGWLIHLVNTDDFVAGVTVGGATAGLIETLLYTYVSAWIFASLYNRFARPEHVFPHASTARGRQ